MKLSVKSFISGIAMFIAIKLVSSYLPIGVVYTLVEVIVGMVVYFILLLVLRCTFFIDLLKLIWETIVSRLRGGRLNEKS